jgi:regulator of RNase E activity RraB
MFAEMTDNWKPYLCNVNGKLASILVNLGLRGSAPISSKPWLLWVWVYFQSPRPDGLSDDREAPTLYKIEDALTPRLAQACQALLSGRITTEGRREFYFYAEAKAGFRKAVADALVGFEGYKFDLGEQEDSSWGQYLNVLYPSLEGLERIANMDLLDELVKSGDVLTIPREVQHWLSFRSEQSRALFCEAARGAGYGIVGETESEGEFPFGMSVTRTQSIQQKLIDQTVIELLRLCRTFNGDYEGWETQVVTE